MNRDKSKKDIEKGAKFACVFADDDFSFIPKLLKAFPGSKIYLVGGAVRDLILGRPTKDHDFAVCNVPAKKLEKFLSGLGDVDLVGRNFGVYKFLPKGRNAEPFDVALPRIEHSLGDGGYRDFKVQSDPKLPITADLARRDFTINAIAFELAVKNKKVFVAAVADPHGGLEDIKKKIIRAVGSSKERFAEDYSRILRGLRFSVQLGFKIDPGTFRAIKLLAPRLNDVKKGVRVTPTETIAREFLKSMSADSVVSLDLWDESGAIKTLMPELLKMKKCAQPDNFHTEGDVWAHTRLALSVLASKRFEKEFGKGEADAETILGVLFHDIGKPPTMQTPKEHGVDRIRFNNHDKVGAELAESIARRLTFSAPAEFSVSAERLAAVIRHHLITVHGQVEKLRNSTIEKYFFNPSFPGNTLMKVIFCDSLATVLNTGKPDLSGFKALKARISKLKLLAKKKPLLPPPLLNGDEIMRYLRIKPGPQVGELLGRLREEQLAERVKTKDQAKNFLLKKK